MVFEPELGVSEGESGATVLFEALAAPFFPCLASSKANDSFTYLR